MYEALLVAAALRAFVTVYADVRLECTLLVEAHRVDLILPLLPLLRVLKQISKLVTVVNTTILHTLNLLWLVEHATTLLHHALTVFVYLRVETTLVLLLEQDLRPFLLNSFL